MLRVLLAAALFVLPGVAVAADHVVRSGDTLWSIASARQGAYGKAGVAQIAWGLARANPEALARGPGKLQPGTRLLLPSTATVVEVGDEESRQKVRELYAAHAQALPRALRPPAPRIAPAPAAPPVVAADTPSQQPALATAPPPGAPGAPRVTDIELQPAAGTDARQWLAIIGEGFKPGARLEFFDIASNRALTARIPASVVPGRVEYMARFGDEPSRWRVTVRNPDGLRSAPYEFEAGRNVRRVASAEAPPPVERAEAPGAAFKDSADAQMLARDPAERYQQLAAMEDRYAGDVDYDYGVGATAVDAGKYTEAVFPLQRAVATKPDFAGARLELARAYYGVGDNESARREFTSLREQRPPPRVEEMIQLYLDAIDRRAAEYRRQASAYAEIAAGHDSNANGATDSQVFLGFNLNDRSRAAESAYYGLNVGGVYSHPVARGWRAQADAHLSSRQLPDAAFVDAAQARAAGGVEWRHAAVTLSGTGSYTYAELDGEENHTNTAFDLGATLPFRESWRLGLGARRAALRFTDALSVQDVDSTLFSAALSATHGRYQWSAGITGGKDEPVESGSTFGRSLAGARVGALVDTGRSRYLFATIAGLQSDYDKPFLGAFERKDTQYSAQVGLDWREFPARLWSIKTQVTYVDNQSDVLIFDYDRFDAGVSLRRDFR